MRMSRGWRKYFCGRKTGNPGRVREASAKARGRFPESLGGDKAREPRAGHTRAPAVPRSSILRLPEGPTFRAERQERLTGVKIRRSIAEVSRMRRRHIRDASRIRRRSIPDASQTCRRSIRDASTINPRRFDDRSTNAGAWRAHGDGAWAGRGGRASHPRSCSPPRGPAAGREAGPSFASLRIPAAGRGRRAGGRADPRPPGQRAGGATGAGGGVYVPLPASGPSFFPQETRFQKKIKEIKGG